MADAIDMKKLIHIIAASLLVAAVLSGIPAKAHEKHGKAMAKHTAAKKRAGAYKVSSSRKSARTIRTVRLSSTTHIAKNALHKETRSYTIPRAFSQQKGIPE